MECGFICWGLVQGHYDLTWVCQATVCSLYVDLDSAQPQHELSSVAEYWRHKLRHVTPRHFLCRVLLLLTARSVNALGLHVKRNRLRKTGV